MDAKPEKMTVIYDDECPLCVRFKQSFERVYQDEVVFSPLSNKGVFEKFPQLNAEACSQDLHLIDSEGQVFVGPKALEKIIEKFPFSEKFKWLYQSENGKKAVDFFYSKTHALREKIKNHCPGCA